MNLELFAVVLFGLIILAGMSIFARRASTINREYFRNKWQEITEMTSTKATWFQAIVEGDKLLEEALKQANYGGKSTADRMVKANRAFSDPDSAWKAHKIRNKVVHETDFKLKKAHVNQAMSGFRQALKDLGAL